jgi:hypothetical protein
MDQPTMTEPAATKNEADQTTAADIAPPARPASRPLTWCIAAVLIALSLLVDFETPRQFAQMSFARGFSGFATAILMALCIAQVNLIAVGASIAAGNIVARLSWSLLLATAMWYALVLGNRSVNRNFQLSDAVLLGATLLSGVVILQIPLWIAKKAFRWRLSDGRDDVEQIALEDRQFNIRHMLLAMFLLSVALSPLRTVLPPGDGGDFHFDVMTFVLLTALVVCNLLVTMPCVWWAFSSTGTVTRRVLGWLAYCAVVAAIEFLALLVVIGVPRSPVRWLEIALLLFLLNVAQCAAVFGTLLLFRAIGFRLVRLPPAH